MASYELKYDIDEKVQIKGQGNIPAMNAEVYAVTIVRHLGEPLILYKVQYLEFGEIKVLSVEQKMLLPFGAPVIVTATPGNLRLSKG
jgi:hypothetical protein